MPRLTVTSIFHNLREKIQFLKNEQRMGKNKFAHPEGNQIVVSRIVHG